MIGGLHVFVPLVSRHFFSREIVYVQCFELISHLPPTVLEISKLSDWSLISTELWKLLRVLRWKLRFYVCSDAQMCSDGNFDRRKLQWEKRRLLVLRNTLWTRRKGDSKERSWEFHCNSPVFLLFFQNVFFTILQFAKTSFVFLFLICWSFNRQESRSPR